MFIQDYLGPALQDAGLDTRIIAYDHNWDQAVEYTDKVLGDEQAAAYIDGSAFHCYAGDPSAMSEVHERFPDKNIYFTECSGGEWSPDFGKNLSLADVQSHHWCTSQLGKKCAALEHRTRSARWTHERWL